MNQILRAGTQITGLKDFCRSIKNENIEINSIVEIGSFIGESVYIFRQEFPNAVIHCIDPWLPGYDDLDFASNNMTNAESLFDIHTKELNINKLKGTSLDFTKDFKKVDLVYIDGLHTKEGITSDIELWKNKVTKIIAGHDYNNPLHPDVKPTIDKLLGKPDFIFEDTSWYKKIN